MSRRSETGQSAIEMLLVLPVCASVALGLAAVGSYAQQRIAVADAASAAAVAHVAGADPLVAAQAVLSDSEAGDVHVRTNDAAQLHVRARVRAWKPFALLLPTQVESHVELDGGVA
jgi:Flp pilus assembly protein TadG